MQVAAERAYPTPAANSTLLPLLLLSLARQRHSPEPTCTFKNEYDYIIVGAGAAGSVVASRLSEYPCVNVLLLEAGHKAPLLTEVPGFSRYFRNSDVDWMYRTVPQLYSSSGYVNNQVPMAGGKMLGGSSSMNTMLYVRGNRKNYDDWEDLGATGWSYNDVYPYFLKLEDNRNAKFLSNGFYDFQASIRDNQRCSTAKAYLVPAENRTNLDIVANAFVTKVLIEGGQATGVQFDFQGQTFQIKARREVILSAGAVNTPQILKLSGVGPREELQMFNIPVVADLPVGHNFRNDGGVHYPFTLGPFEPDFHEKLSNFGNIYQYIENRTGPLASTDGYLFMSFLKGMSTAPIEDFPNYSLYIFGLPISRIRNAGLTKEVFDKVYGEYENQAIFACAIEQIQPYSKGAVTLQSANPYVHPLIDPNFLSDYRDVDEIVDGLKACKRLVATDAFRRLGATPLKTKIPGCESLFGNDDEYFRCQARTMFYSVHHPVGTARMGNSFDPNSVVDPQLKVKNVRNLRVVDASVMPLPPSGNTHIPTIMVAEKASDMIKQTIKCFDKRPLPPQQISVPEAHAEFL